MILSLKEHSGSWRVFTLISLLVLGMGILALAVFFVWKSHVKEPQVSDERKRVPIERQGKATISPDAAEKRTEEGEARVSEVKSEEPEVKVEEVAEPQIFVVKKPNSRAIPKAEPPTDRYCVNVASCKKRANAESLVNELKIRDYTASIKEVTIPGRGTWYRVALGPFSSKQEAQAVARAFGEKEGMECFVTLAE